MAVSAIGNVSDGPDTWTRRNLAIVVLCFAINMADGIDVTIVSFIAPRLQAEWQIGADVMGSLFSAGLLGMAIGGMFIAPLADRFGRRRIILAALALMSGGMIASGLVTGVAEFFLMRVIVGAGIGTVLAAMAALASECAPPRQRNLAVGMVQAGYPFAAVFTGLLVARLLPSHGWEVLLMSAGVITIILFPAAWLLLPTRSVSGEDSQTTRRVSALFSPAFRARTIFLWGAVFFGLMVLYFITSWITKLSIQAGLSETNGIYAGSLYNLGAFVGTSIMSILAVRLPLGKVVPAMLAMASVAMLVFGNVPMSIVLTLLVAFAIGVLMQGGYNGVWPIAASVYPAEFRATGIGWAIGIGRSGAIIGPMAAGYLLAAKLSLGLLFGAFCIPLLACAFCAWSVQRLALRAP